VRSHCRVRELARHFEEFGVQDYCVLNYGPVCHRDIDALVPHARLRPRQEQIGPTLIELEAHVIHPAIPLAVVRPFIWQAGWYITM